LGPGEFSQWSTFALHFVKEGEIWAIGGGKVARFDMERNFLGETKPGGWLSDAVYIDETSFVAKRSEQVGEEKEMREWVIISFGKMIPENKSEILFDYFKATDVGMIRKGRSAIAEEWATPRIYWAYDDIYKRVYTVLNTEYKITSHELKEGKAFSFLIKSTKTTLWIQTKKKNTSRRILKNGNFICRSIPMSSAPSGT